MFLWMKKALIVPAIFLVLLAALFFVSPVSADDGGPADTTVPPEVVTTDAPALETPAPDAASPTPTEAGEAIVEETPAPTTEPVDEAATLPETLEELAASGIALVDATGESLTLPTRSSGNVVVNGDPYFNIGSVRYYFMKGDDETACEDSLGVPLPNCVYSWTPIQDALDYMVDHNVTPTDRKLYITADLYDEDVVVDGSLDGVSGLTGLVGKLETGETAEDVIINGHLYIHDMAAGFSVSNLRVVNTKYSNDAAIWAYDNSGTITLTDVIVHATEQDSSGIMIYNTGAVVLNRVTSNGNAYKGADINASGAITVLNSTFDENLQNVNDGNPMYEASPWYVGLFIKESTAAAVTLNGVTAINNIGDGVQMFAAASPVTIKNSEFNDNDQGHVRWAYGYGLTLTGNTVTLENINANNNDRYGIRAQAYTSVTGTRLYLFYNDGFGLNASTCMGYTGPEPWCHNSGAGTVTLTTISAFQNGMSGVYAYAKGLVTITDLYAALNSSEGLLINNQIAPTPVAVNLTMVTTNANYIGISILTKGAVNGKNVVADGNTNEGITIQSSGTAPITFTIDAAAPEKFNQTEYNGANGLSIFTLGAVSLTSFSANGNLGFGVEINNFPAATAMPVTITVLAPTISYNTYTENSFGGLSILSRGAVTLKYIDASNNQGFGAEISNVTPVGVPGALVSISDSSFNWNCNHDDMGCYWTGDTDQFGLAVDSKGAITLLNVDAKGNYGFGADLNNNYTGATGAVSINAGTGRTNNFSNNAGNGLMAFSKGAITATNLDASGNNGFGAQFVNYYTGVTSGVTLNAGTGMVNYFENNHNDGLYIRSNGAVTATNIAANYTVDGFGVSIYNTTGSGAVTVKQVLNSYFGGNTFNGNSDTGLRILSNGAVTVTYGRASENGSEGVFIQNYGGTGAVTVTATNANSNSNNNTVGISIYSLGNITLNGIQARNNVDFGADLENYNGTGSVTINNGYFDGNFAGLYVRTSGAVIWKNGSASNNAEVGADITNSMPLVAGKPVTITNVSTNNNSETGLRIESKGAVTLTQVEAYGNSANYYWLNMGQPWIDNMSDNQTWYFTAPGSGEVTVDVSSINFFPTIEIYDIDGNLENSITGSAGDVSLTTSGLTSGETYYIRLGTNTWNGDAYQIDIFEGSAPYGGTFEDPILNNANGVYVDNSTGTAAAVTFTNPTWTSWIANNSGSNVYILSSGVVTLSNMDLNNSAQYGLDVNNAGAVATPGITITGVNFGWNDASGAWIRSKGAVTIKNSDASQNGGSLSGWGYDIQNNLGTTAMPVSLTNTYAYGNADDGIYIRSNGAVTLNTIASNNNGISGIDIEAMGVVTLTNIQANDNADYGAIIMALKDLIINKPATGANNFDDNGNTGLHAETGAKVTITRVRASGNDGNGVYIEVHNLLGTSPVVLTDIITSDNTETGTEIITTGAVTITALGASNNSVYGLYVEQDATTPAGGRFAIALSKIATSGNGYDGIWVESLGNITLSKFEASFNTGSGVVLNNTAGNGTVTILNPAGGAAANTAIVNGGVGVNIESNGAVNITGLETSSNTLDGLVIDNHDSTTSAVVNLTSVRSRFNGVDGSPSSTGISVKSAGLVTINSSWVSDNQADGIEVWTPKNTVINITASINNDWAGLYIDLAGAPTPGNLTLNGCFWFGNLRNDPYPTDTNLIFMGGGILTIL